MAFDGMVMRAVVHELQQCVPGRINKIVMPGAHEVELHIRAAGANWRWLLCADSTVPRTHLRQISVERPGEPPTFCMLLRKQLEGGWIEQIRQIGDERVIHVHIRTQNELGDFITRVLVFELMGKHSNLILLNSDPTTGEAIILDSIHHVTPAVSRHRIVLPGCSYTPPPEQHKHSLISSDWSELVSVITNHLQPFAADSVWEKELVQLLSGWSPLLARQAVQSTHQSRGGRVLTELIEQLASWRKQWLDHHYDPNRLLRSTGQLQFSIIPLVSADSSNPDMTQRFDSISACIESVFHERGELEKRRQRAHDLFQVAQSELHKTTSKIDKLHEQLRSSDDAEQWRQRGELLVAMQHSVARGSTSVTLVNYFDESLPELTIPLDPTKGAPEQAQAFFKKYNKLKTSIPMIQEQLQKAQHDRLYWDAILQQLEIAGFQDLEEIREELLSLGHIRQRKQNNRKKNTKSKPQPMHIQSTDGISIYIGKNNLQNDYVTFRLAHDQHWWLHTKDIPGSHVVIADSNPSEQTIREAVMLACWFSKGRQSSQVPVDMTRVRHVRKPNGAKPGFVIYEQQRTLVITPDENEILRLLEPSKK